MSTNELSPKPIEPEVQIIKNFKGADILSARQFDRESLSIIFDKTDVMEDVRRRIKEERRYADHLSGYRLVTLFYEPSTRTRLSFGIAMKNLGGELDSENSAQFSSTIKGERLEDTVRVVEIYDTDVIALRHPSVGSSQAAAEAVKIPVINAGDGEGEHPTQALLDLYTIQKEIGSIDGSVVTIVGDLKHGRTTHSLAHLLSLFDVKINLVSPSYLQMPTELVDELRGKGTEVNEFNKLDEVPGNDYDVLYVTRVQTERIKDIEHQAVAAHLNGFDKLYAIEPEFVSQIRAVIMHPLPRVNELPPEIDKLPNAAYFRQVENGFNLRMALLSLLLKGE